MENVILEVDASDLTSKLTMLQAACKPERYRRALHRIYSRTGKHVRQIMKTDLPKQYAIGANRVGKAVMNAKVQDMGCIIPIRDKRGSIGKGGQYTASGGAHGWQSLHRKYRVKAKILKNGRSILPANAASYGGKPPFRNLSAGSLHGLTFTREGQERLPIRKMAGIAIPQMPMNRSQEDVQRDIHNWLAKQIEHEFMNVMRGI